MNCDVKKRIVGNYVKLVNGILMSEISDHLFQEGVIDDEQLEEITEVPMTRKAKTRRVLSILIAKNDPAILEKFCSVLAANPAYAHLAEAIRKCDVSSLEDTDVVDSRNNPYDKGEELVKTVMKQSDELIKVNEEYRRRIAELQETNEALQQRQSWLMTLEQSGFSEKSVVNFVDVFVLAKKFNNSSTLDGAENRLCPDILEKFSSESLSQDELKACWLSIYIVQVVATGKCRHNLPDSLKCYSVNLRNIVNTAMKKHGDVFNQGIENLHIKEINGLNTFDAVADEMFFDGVYNWGRVLAWFAFCASLAKKFPDSTLPDSLDAYAVFSWFYINKRMRTWIVEAGGWDSFLEFLLSAKMSSSFRWFSWIVDWFSLLWRHYP